jgi:hypothetical protein
VVAVRGAAGPVREHRVVVVRQGVGSARGAEDAVLEYAATLALSRLVVLVAASLQIAAQASLQLPF